MQSLARSALDELEGATIRRRPAHALTDVREILDRLATLAAGSSDPTGSEPPYTGVLAGIDTALLDLAARAADTSMAALLGGRRRPLVVCTSVTHVGRETALEVTSRVATVTGHAAPTLLCFGEWIGLTGVAKLIEQLAQQVAAGALPPHLVLHVPVDADRSELSEAQQHADRLVPPADAGPGIVLMPDAGCTADARDVADRGVRAVNVNPFQLGGALSALDVAAALGDAASRPRIGLVPPRFLSDVGLRATAELAAALPHVDYFSLPAPETGQVQLEPGIEHDRQGRLLPGGEPGIGGHPVLAPAVQHLTGQVASSSARSRPPTYDGLPLNGFDIATIAPFFSARGVLISASALLERAALVRGLDITRFSRGLFFADHPALDAPVVFTPNNTAWSAVPPYRLTSDKDLTRKILLDSGVPAPRGAAFDHDQVEHATAFAASLGTPVVVKPRKASHGEGVSTDLRSEAHVRHAIDSLAASGFGDRPFVVEEHIPGNDYRFLVVGDRVVSVVLKRPASVTGDGRSTVADLVLEKNRWRLRNPHTRGCPLAFGPDTMAWLARHELTTQSVPAAGRTVRLGSAGNIATGGESIEVLDQTHASLLDLAVRAVHVFPGLDHAGIDLMGDHRLGVDGHPTAILEINSMPATSLNHFPLFGTPRDVSSDIVLRACALAGFHPDRPRDELSVRMLVRGRVQHAEYLRWFARLAEERDVAGRIRQLPSGGVEAVISGPALDIWVLVNCAIAGPPRALVNQVSTTHIDSVRPVDRFEVHT
ncbi:acylphosphatase [Phytoactinopolyspora endophytica]|uniref:acylphosphatase n=1 Tax=Phytoactinopolyspora endophytica TaxID=1642495 RepID=UPI00197C1E70|nr:acylphosphatase [Phytoactinopolyspora endophytica]